MLRSKVGGACFIIWVATLIVDPGTSLIAFDCKSKSVNITSISLVTTPSCEISQKNLTYESVTLAVTQACFIFKEDKT